MGIFVDPKLAGLSLPDEGRPEGQPPTGLGQRTPRPLPKKPKLQHLIPPPAPSEPDWAKSVDQFLAQPAQPKVEPPKGGDWERDVDSFLGTKQSPAQKPWYESPDVQGVGRGAAAEGALALESIKGVGETLKKASGEVSKRIIKAMSTDPLLSAWNPPLGLLKAIQEYRGVPWTGLTDTIDPSEYSSPGAAKAVTVLHNVGRHQAEFFTDPVNIALLVGSGGVAEAAPAVSTALDAGFAALQAEGAAQGVVNAAQQFKQGDYWGGAESSVEALMSAGFSVGGAMGARSGARRMRFMGNAEKIAQRDFGKPYMQLDPIQRTQVAENLLTKLNQPHYHAMASDIATKELFHDLKDIKRYNDAKRAGREVQLPGRLKEMPEEAIAVLSHQADHVFGEAPSSVPRAPDIEETADIRKLDDQDLHSAFTSLRVDLADQKLGEKERAESQAKLNVVEKELGRRRILNLGKTGVEEEPGEDLQSEIQHIDKMPEDELDRRAHDRRAWAREAVERARGRAAKVEGVRKGLLADIRGRRAEQEEAERVPEPFKVTEKRRVIEPLPSERKVSEAPEEEVRAAPPSKEAVEPPAPAEAPPPVTLPSPPKGFQPPPSLVPDDQFGSASPAKVARGYTVGTRYAVVDADKLVTSHDMKMQVNPEYKQELQPRDRTRAASEEQVNRIYAELDPREITESYKASGGAPIIGSDMMVESGNARTIALKRLYRDAHGNAEAYRKHLSENASKFGLTPEAVDKIKNPVLVRVRTEPVNRERFAIDAGESAEAAMSELEQAKTDAKQMNVDLLGLLKPSESGEVFTASNQGFINAFVENVVSPKDRGDVITAKGELSAKGLRRIRHALFAKAYPGAETTLEKFTEDPDSNIRNTAGGMLVAAPRMAILQEEMNSGRVVPGLGIEKEIDAAATKISQLRAQGSKVEDWLKQIPMPGMSEDVSPATRTLIDLFNRYARSPKGVGAVLDTYAEEAIMKGRTDQTSMFGEGSVVTKEGLLKYALEKAGEPTAGLFDLPPPAAKPPVTGVRAELEAQANALPPDQRNQFLQYAVHQEQEMLPHLQGKAAEDSRARLQAAQELLGGAAERKTLEPPPKVEAKKKPIEKPPEKFGAANKLVGTDEAEAIRKRMRENLNRLSAGLPADMMADAAKLGLYYLEGGVRKFGEWSKHLVDDFGEKIREHLPALWREAHSLAWRMAGEKPELRDYVGSITKGGEVRGDIRKPEEALGGKERPRGGKVAGPAAGPPRPESSVAPRGAEWKPAFESRGTAAPAAIDPAEWAKTKWRYRLPDGSPSPTTLLSPEISAQLLPDTVPLTNMALSSLVDKDAVVLAAETGSGKTYMGSAIMKELLNRMGPGAEKAKFLIVTPRVVHDKWIDVASKFGLKVTPYPKGETVPKEPGVYSITYDQAVNRKGIEKYPWDLVLADESHYARRWYESQRGGMLSDLSRNAKKALYTSATPFHTALEMGYMEKLGLWKPGEFEKWVNQFGARREQRGWVSDHNPKKLARLQNELIRDGRMVGRERSMEGQKVGFGLVPLDATQKQQMRDAIKAFNLAESYFANVKHSRAMVRAVLGNKVNFLKSFLERARMPAVIELAKKFNAQGWKVAVFTEHRSPVDDIYNFLREADQHYGGEISRLFPKLPGVSETLKEAFGDQIGVFMGPSSGARTRELEKFQSDEVKNLAATYAAGGIGVDAHDLVGDKPRVAFFLGPPWSGILLDQGLGRTHRAGSKSEAINIFLSSDSKAELETLVGKVIPRMESLRAIVSGVEKGDPVVKGLQNSTAVISYALGAEDKPGEADFSNFLSSKGIHNYSEIPIPAASEHMNKPRKVEREGEPPEMESHEGGTLFSGIDPTRAAREIRNIAQDISRALKSKEPVRGTYETQSFLDELQRAYKKGMDKALPHETDKDAFTEVAAAQAEAAGARAPDNPVGQAKASIQDDAERLTNLDKVMDRLGRTSGVRAGMGMKDFLFTTGRSLIKKVGGPVGEKIVRDIEAYHADSANIAGRYQTRFYDATHGLSDAEVREMAHRIQDPTGERSLNLKVQKAVNEVRGIFTDAWKEQHDQRIQIPISGPEGRRLVMSSPDPNYFPRMYPPEAYQPGTTHHEGVIANLMRQKGMKRAQAEDFMSQFGNRDVPLAGNLEKPRVLDVEGYRKDRAVLYQYAAQLGEVIARAKHFGQFREKLNPVVQEITGRRDRQIVNSVMDQLLETKPADEATQALNQFASTWTALTKMTFSVIPVMSHSVKAALLANTRSYVKAILQTPFRYGKMRREAMESGAIVDSLRDAALREYNVGLRSVGAKALKTVGFFWADRLGRVLGDATARNYLRSSLGKLQAGNEFYSRYIKEKFHITDAEIQQATRTGAWSKQALDRAGARMAHIVQGTYDPTELPPAWRVKGNDPASQFGLGLLRQTFALKSYIWKNGVVIRDQLLGEARKGNLRPWIPFLTLMPFASEILEDLRQLSRGKTERISALGEGMTVGQAVQRYAEDLAVMGGANYAFSMIEASLQSKVGAAEMLLGPVIGDLAKGFDTGMQVMRDIGDEKYEKIPERFHSFARRTVVPYRALTPTPPKGRRLEAPPSGGYSFPTQM